MCSQSQGIWRAANTLKHIFICLYRNKQHILEEIIKTIPKFQNNCITEYTIYTT